VTYHHNLYAHHDSRNPRLGDNIGLDFVNNVVFDWGNEAGYSGDSSEGSPRLNYVGNYLIAGPTTPASKRIRAFNGGSTSTNIYQANNSIDSNVNGAHDGTNTEWGMFIGSYTRQESARFQFPQVNTDDSANAYDRVLNLAGMSLFRDSVDTRVLSEVRNETGRHIDSQNQVGGWPTLNSLPAPADTDQDGMPDAWETNHGLNPLDPSDGPAIGGDGYSNLEKYLNDITAVTAAGSILVNESCPAANGLIDPGERDSVNLKLMNAGKAATSNLVATLLPNANVIAPSGPQTYGAIAPNSTAGRDFSFTANGNCGDVITLTLQLQDGTTDLGTVTYNFTLGCNTACAGQPVINVSTALSCNGTNTVVTVTASNTGTATALNVVLTTVKFGTANGTSLPLSLGNLAPGASSVKTVTLSGAANGATLQVSGTHNGGTFGSTRRVTPPTCTVAGVEPSKTGGQAYLSLALLSVLSVLRGPWF